MFGPYQMLAQMAHQAYREGDDVRATLYARILERIWDKDMMELRQTSPRTWEQINSNMNDFIKPILQYAGGDASRPDPATEDTAYRSYCLALRLVKVKIIPT